MDSEDQGPARFEQAKGSSAKDDPLAETSTGETRIRQDSESLVRSDGLPAELGEILGGYALESVLGRGGMGCVFLGRHQVLKREAAVKVLASHLSADQSYVSRFFHEAQIVNEVNHPNIVEIIDFVQVKDPVRVAYVMEVLRGQPLSTLVTGTSLTFEQSMNLCFQLCDALVAVHSAGVVHRDLKPENIFVTASVQSDFSYVPSVKILDFGIAKKQTGDVSHQTATGAIIGTPAYMAPEQISGGKITDKTDVYAMGEILYEMLTGDRLFVGENMDIMKSKLIHEIPRFTLGPSIPNSEALTSLLQHSMTQSPTKRPDMKQFARAVLEYCPGVRVSRAVSSDKLLDTEALLRTPLPTALSTPYHLSTASSASLTGLPKKRSILPMIGVVLLVASLGIAGFFFQESGRVVPSVSLPSAPLEKAETQRPERKPAPVVPEPKAPIISKVRLLSEPVGVQVFDAETNRLLGTSPLIVEVEEGSTKKVKLVQAGYEDLTTFLNSTDKEKGFNLVKLPPKMPEPVKVKSSAPSAPKRVTPKSKPAPIKKPARNKESTREDDDPFSKREVPEW